MTNTLYLPELREMLAEDNSKELRLFCEALHPARTAEFMDGLTASEAWAVLRHAEVESRIEIFGFFDDEKQVGIVETCDREEVAQLITDLPSDDRVDLLEWVDNTVVDEILSRIPAEERRDILRLSEYPADTAGAIMTSEIARLPESITVGEAFERIQTAAAEWETIYYVYTVDEENHLRGVVTARQLLSHASRPETPIADLMERDVFSVEVDEDQEQVADKVAQYDLHAIPVVDNEHRLLGIITHDDIIDVVREEAAEDAHRIAAVEPLEESYLQTHWLTLIKKRLPWLVVLFFAALLTAFLLQAYESELHSVAWLAIFIPLIISSGGNTGNQSATLIITAMTTGDLEFSDFGRVIRRELVSGVILGGFLGILSFAIAYAAGLAPSAIGATVVLFTVFLVVVCGTLCGAVLPILFRRLGLDPALMSNPFVAGIVDILGIVIYMAIAKKMLDGMAGG